MTRKLFRHQCFARLLVLAAAAGGLLQARASHISKVTLLRNQQRPLPGKLSEKQFQWRGVQKQGPLHRHEASSAPRDNSAGGSRTLSSRALATPGGVPSDDMKTSRLSVVLPESLGRRQRTSVVFVDAAPQDNASLSQVILPESLGRRQRVHTPNIENSSMAPSAAGLENSSAPLLSQDPPLHNLSWPLPARRATAVARLMLRAGSLPSSLVSRQQLVSSKLSTIKKSSPEDLGDLGDAEALAASISVALESRDGAQGRGSMSLVMTIIFSTLVTAVILLGCIIIYDHTAKPDEKSVPSGEVADTSAQVRQWVQSLPVLSTSHVKELFHEHGGYDCLLMQPQTVPGAVRLEGIITAAPHNILKAPLAKRSCVLFSTSASAVRLDGVRAPPTAFNAMNSDFELELLGGSIGSTEIRVHLRGRDAVLFDVASGWRLERTVLADAPEHLQDFLHAHRAPGVEMPDDTEVMDFTECLLAVGSHVTCVGELRREPTGELGLWPLQNSGVPAAAMASSAETMPGSPHGMVGGLTSWERTGLPSGSICRSPRVGKVMISDDPGLLSQSSSNIFARLARRTRDLSSIFQSSASN